jgi:FkbM family methyltransferase
MPRAAAVFERLPRILRRHRFMRAWMWATGEDPLQLVRIRDRSFAYADLRNGFLRLIVIDQGFEADFFELADALLGGGGVFIDIGANHGLLSFGLAGRHADKISFHLFEPNPRMLPSLQRSLALYPAMQCTLNATALSDRAGQVGFLIEEEHSGMSRVVATGGVTVASVTLDDYLDRAQIDVVGLVKIDVEGHELGVLRGARASLVSRRIQGVYFEYCEKWLKRTHPPSELIDFLESAGYQICFCRREDLGNRGGGSHTFRPGLPGHGIELLPVTTQRLPETTDLVAVPRENLVPRDAH